MSVRCDFTNLLALDKFFFVARRDVTDKLDQHLADSGSVRIYGVARVGKSAMTRHCAQVFGALRNAAVREVRFKGEESFNSDSDLSLRDQFKEKLGDLLLEDATRRLVVIDEIDYGLTMWPRQKQDQLTDFFNFCTALMGKGVQFLMAGQELPEDWKDQQAAAAACPPRESFWDVEIKPFTEEELAEYCGHSKAPVGKSLVRWIHEKTGGLAGPVNSILQRHNSLFRRGAKTPTLAELANDPLVQGVLKCFPVPSEKPDKPAEKAGKRQRPNSGGHSHLQNGLITPHVFLSNDRKTLKVEGAPSKRFRITNQEAWNFIDRLLKRAKNNADGYLMLDSKTKRVFRRGEARQFIDECIDYLDQKDTERTPRPPTRVRFKKKFVVRRANS